MEDAQSILVIIVSSVLTILLLLLIVVVVLVIKLLRSVKRVTDKAEKVVNSAEVATELFVKSTEKLSILQLVKTITKLIAKQKKKES